MRQTSRRPVILAFDKGAPILNRNRLIVNNTSIDSMSERLTRARLFINFAKKLGLGNAHNPSNPISLRIRVARCFETGNSLRAQSAILISTLTNLDELEHETRDYATFDDALRAECLASIVQLKNYVGPSYWDHDTSQWAGDVEKHIRNLTIVDSILAHGLRNDAIPSELLESLTELLEGALTELENAVVADNLRKTRLIRALKGIIQYFKNADCMSLDDAIEIATSSIFEAAEFAAKEKGWHRSNIVVNALVMVHVALTGARDVRDNVQMIKDITAEIVSVSNTPTLPKYLQVKALPAPATRKGDQEEGEEVEITV